MSNSNKAVAKNKAELAKPRRRRRRRVHLIRLRHDTADELKLRYLEGKATPEEIMASPEYLAMDSRERIWLLRDLDEWAVSDESVKAMATLNKALALFEQYMQAAVAAAFRANQGVAVITTPAGVFEHPATPVTVPVVTVPVQQTTTGG